MTEYTIDTDDVREKFADPARSYRNDEEARAAFDRWLLSVKRDTFAEGYYYASNGKWGNLELGENPYGDEEEDE